MGVLPHAGKQRSMVLNDEINEIRNSIHFLIALNNANISIYWQIHITRIDFYSWLHYELWDTLLNAT